ncbi:hypothetical protein BH20GEM1_BH20GEM1_17300 [soil metagenome]
MKSKPRKQRSRVFWKNGRAYVDLRDLGGGREALIPLGGKRLATTDPDVAAKLAADRVTELTQARREGALLGLKKRERLGDYAAQHLVEKAATALADETIAAKELNPAPGDRVLRRGSLPRHDRRRRHQALRRDARHAPERPRRHAGRGVGVTRSTTSRPCSARPSPTSTSEWVRTLSSRGTTSPKRSGTRRGGWSRTTWRGSWKRPACGTPGATTLRRGSCTPSCRRSR